MLAKFKAVKIKEVERLKELKEKGNFPKPFEGEKKSLLASLQGKKDYKVIAEYKRSSPSKGVINKNLSIEDVALSYKKNGATALSILTEQEYFAGDLSFIQRAYFANLPLLRKDFIYHPLQVEETLSTPAKAILLIVRFFEDFFKLKDIYEFILSKDLEPVVEVFSLEDLKIAKRLKAKIIQVNNRDLDRLCIDFTISKNLVRYKEEAEVWIAASGIKSFQNIQELSSLGYDAFLVGTHLMAQEDPGKALRELLGKGGEDVS